MGDEEGRVRQRMTRLKAEMQSRRLSSSAVPGRGGQAEDANGGVVGRWFVKSLGPPEHPSGPLCGGSLSS